MIIDLDKIWFLKDQALDCWWEIGTGIVVLFFPPLLISLTCPQGGWDGFRNVGIQDLLPDRSRGMKVKPRTFILLEKNGLSRKRGDAGWRRLVDGIVARVIGG